MIRWGGAPLNVCLVSNQVSGSYSLNQQTLVLRQGHCVGGQMGDIGTGVGKREYHGAHSVGRADCYRKRHRYYCSSVDQ